MKPLPSRFVRWLKETCNDHQVPIIADEIQSGMGRTGSFLASTAMGLNPDYVCLGKALGGGLAKIGALLIRRNQFLDDFAIEHTSTFSEDESSCLIALKGLEILRKDKLIERCAAAGDRLIAKLRALQSHYPEVVQEIRGRGLMIGMQLHDQSNSPSNIFRMLSEQGHFGYMAAAYFLNRCRIRILPTLSSSLTLRIEPSAYLSKPDISDFIRSTEQFCEAVVKLDLRHLTHFENSAHSQKIIDYRGKHRIRRMPPTSEKRVAFVGNFIESEHARKFDASLGAFRPEELERHMASLSHFIEPAIYDQINVVSRLGDVVHLSFIGLNLTTRQIVAAMQSRKTRWILDKLNASSSLAAKAGCTVLGLGGHTSIVSANGVRLRPQQIALTSGNALTVGMALVALRTAAAEKGIDLSESRLAVLGANGNIGRTCASILAPEVRELVLIGRKIQTARFQSLVHELKSRTSGTNVHGTDNLEHLSDCSLIVAASSSPDPLILPRHLGNHPLIICDIATPGDVDPSVSRERPAAFVVRGAEVRAPMDDNFAIGGIPTKKGQMFPCMAETLLLGLEGIYSGSCGRISVQNVNLMLKLAEKHAFTLAPIETPSGSNE